METLIHNAIIVNEGRRFRGSLLIEGDRIKEIREEPGAAGSQQSNATEIIDAQGGIVMPGVIDTHVHFREPGLTSKADIAHESRAALAGGVTSIMDMPNVLPPTTSLERWREHMDLLARHCRVNYTCYIAATNQGIETPPPSVSSSQPGLTENPHDTAEQEYPNPFPPVKIFLGSTTGGMLIDDLSSMLRVFNFAATRVRRYPVVAHCEDNLRIQSRMAEAQTLWGEDPDVTHHAWIRDAEACYQSSLFAARVARETGARLHIAHISTSRELELLGGNITGEVCVGHLLFTEDDYRRLGTRIKVNPAIKSHEDRDALRQALADGRLKTIATDHAPHEPEAKKGGCRCAASGMPMVQFSLVSMLGLVDEGVLSLERMVDAMCHQPAKLFGIRDRGFLRPGMKADIVIVHPRQWMLRKEDILSKCGWSPLEGTTLHWRVGQVFLNGRLAYDRGQITDDVRGEVL